MIMMMVTQDWQECHQDFQDSPMIMHELTIIFKQKVSDI